MPRLRALVPHPRHLGQGRAVTREEAWVALEDAVAEAAKRAFASGAPVGDLEEMILGDADYQRALLAVAEAEKAGS